MDELIKAFNSLGVSTEVMSLINADLSSMANHYIAHFKSDRMPDFAPNPICDYGDCEEINKGILEYIDTKGEKALIEKILSIDNKIYIDQFEIQTYINYYVSLIELST